MGVVRKALREMQPHVVACGPVGAEKPDEVNKPQKYLVPEQVLRL